ncbi:fumarylacetoacetate hydrolase [Halobacteriales archaeon QS_5_70_15]|nr:MAG: fumarylacetoacetate hydrolase [Halobacteriales archaeon QS_5_70_15]
MRYYGYPSTGGSRLVAEADDGTYDLTAVKPDLASFGDLARAAAVTETGVDDVAERLVDRAPEYDPTDAPRAPGADEVWAAGVTYAISEQAREAESGMPDMYIDVYDAERPEVFLKATPGRTVGPGEAVGVRQDSDWNVPEPELGVVLHRGDVVGYTIGNDVSSRAIEGANPLYLPQAKVYDRCCALGPCIASPGTVGDPHDLGMSMTIDRDGERVFEGSTSTDEMVRTCEELVDYYTRHNAVPERAVLLTGTSIVPPDEFTLRAGDSVTIDIEGIGTLENHVVTV